MDERALAAVQISQEDLVKLDEQRFRDAEALIYRCMRREGHDYVVRDPEVVLNTEFGWTQVPPDQVDQYGYGITIPFGSTLPVENVEPNETLLADLAPSEQDAWRTAFQGEGDRQGCVAEGQKAYEQRSDAELVQQRFAKEIDQLIDRVLADGRIVDAEQKWAQCMAEKGFTYEIPSDAIWEFESAIGEFGGIDVAEEELRPMQARERLVATADAGCPFNNFGSSEDNYDLVYDEYYEEFVRENEAEILAILDAT